MMMMMIPDSGRDDVAAAYFTIRNKDL